MTNLWIPTTALAGREVKRFFRQRSRIVGALLTPLVFWLVIGSGFGKSFQGSERGGYLEYFYPGTLTMILLFTAIFSTISIIEDRNEGFLQGVLVSPVSRSSIVFGKITGASILAIIQATLFLLLSPFVGLHISPLSFLSAMGAFALIAVSLTGLGFVIAWKLNSIQGFHGVMNLLLMPMWLLSGSVFSSQFAPEWLKMITRINPLTYGTALVRRSLYLNSSIDVSNLPAVKTSISVLIIFGFIMYLWCLWEVRRGPATS